MRRINGANLFLKLLLYYMLNFTRHGKGDTLVLIHGFLGGTNYWIPVTTALKDNFDVIAIDLPGFAGSSSIPAPDTLSGYADTVFNLLDDLGIRKCSMLGFSMGGMIVQQAALDHPQRLKKLVLYGSAGVGDLPNRFESWEASIERIKAQGVEATADKTAATWFVEGDKHPFYKICRDACRGANMESCFTVMRAMQKWSAMGSLKRLTHPTLVIVGDKDRSTRPSESYALWEGLPNASLCVVPQAAHGLHMEKPDLFNSIVRDFLLS